MFTGCDSSTEPSLRPSRRFRKPFMGTTLPRGGRRRELPQRDDEAMELATAGRQPVLGTGRAAVDRRPLQDPRLLQFAEPGGEGGRRDPAERLRELAEARRALVRGPDDRHRPTPFEEVRRTADLLGDRRAATTAHAPWPLAPARVP